MNEKNWLTNSLQTFGLTQTDCKSVATAASRIGHR